MKKSVGSPNYINSTGCMYAKTESVGENSHEENIEIRRWDET